MASFNAVNDRTVIKGTTVLTADIDVILGINYNNEQWNNYLTN
jgi:hypothetical protein